MTDGTTEGSGRPSRWMRGGKGAATFIGAAAAIIGAIAVVQGWFESDDPPPRTKVSLVRPFDQAGNLRPPYREAGTGTGRCVLGGSYHSSDPEAARCFSDASEVFDPCWVYGLDRKAACLRSPWEADAWIIEQPVIDLSQPRETELGEVPWALEIEDPAHTSGVLRCGFAGGAGETVAGMRVNWRCFPPGPANSDTYAGDGVGAPKPSATELWTVLYSGRGTSQVVDARIKEVWR